VPEANVETRKLETCHTCLGYVKTMTTLQARPPYAAMLDDLETVALDLIALERGYARPERPGYAAQIECVALPSRLSSFLGRSG
jgi:FdhE protein